MILTGLEIEMLPLGNADCILVTGWEGNFPTRVLIDGGNKGDFDKVRSFLDNSGISHIDHVVCSHPHDDHAGGLLEIAQDRSLTIGKAWMHLPLLNHPLFGSRLMFESYKKSERGKEILETLETIENLEATFNFRNVPIYEPFLGNAIAFLTVCGPAQLFYKNQLAQFIKKKKIASHLQEAIDRVASVEEESASLDNNPLTSPENNCCPILATAIQGKKFVFTADAGVQALQVARFAKSNLLKDCTWLQVPHHGSRRNMTPALVAFFSPRIAYISSEGSHKHPSRAVVNAFKNSGTVVYSTHYPTETILYYKIGNTPFRSHYGATKSLWE